MCCTKLKEFLKREQEQMINAINENKWYLSEKEHHDVGLERAMNDFQEKYLQTWATGFRHCYCKFVCSVECGIRRKI